MKKQILLLILILSCKLIQAHQGTLTGKIIDKQSKLPIEGAMVTLKPYDQQTRTSLSGQFTFNALETGEYQLTFYCLGYKLLEQAVRIDAHDEQTLSISLEPSSTELKELKIQSDQWSNTLNISKYDIGLRPVNNAQDVLRMVPGLFIAQHAGGGKSEQIFLRGFDCDHGTDIALSVDGMPVNMVSHAHGQGYADLHFLIPETIDRISVNKGNYQTQDGNLATAGSVKFQTKNKLDENMISIEGGNFNHLRGVALLNLLPQSAQAKGQNLYFAGEYYYRKGFFDQPDHLHRANGMLKYYSQISKHHQLIIQASHFTSTWNASGQIPTRAVESGLITRFGSIDPTEGGKTHRSNFSAKWITDLHKGRVWSNQLYYSNYGFNLLSNFTFFKNDSVEGDKINQHEKRQILGYQSQYFTHHRIASVDVQSELGIQARYDRVNDNQLSRVSRENNILERLAYGDVREMNLAFYVNEQINLSKQWVVNLGLREDIFLFHYQDKLAGDMKRTQSKARFSPKLQVHYTPSNKLQYYIQSGIGFHSNDTRVVVAQDGKDVLPAAYGAEVGTHYKVLPSLLLSSSLWWLQLKQEFVYVGDEAVVEPSGKTQRVGVDAGFRWNGYSCLYVDADVNVSMPRALGVSKEENKIPLAPTLTSIGGLTIKWKKQFQFALRYRYLADRPGNESNTLRAKGYFLNDAVAEYSKGKWGIALSVENLWNVQWKEAQFETESRLAQEAEPVTEINFTSGTPRALKLKLTRRF